MIPLRVKAMRKAWALGDAKRDEGNVEPSNIKKFKNIEYKKDKCGSLLLDVYAPEDAKEPLPTIVSIHGGGYFYGDKELYRFYCMDLALRGFTVVNFNYRLSPENHFPAPLEDTNAVMEWIVEKGQEYFIDKDKLFLIGDSAGAQLASHYGAIYSNAEFAALFDFKVPDIKILGLSLACGMYELSHRLKEGSTAKLLYDYIGKKGSIDDPRLRVTSYIDGNFPPSYVFTAYYDFLKEECEPFHKLLLGKGIHTIMQCYGTENDKELGHVFHVNMKLPEAKACNDAQCAFFGSLI